MDSQIVKMILDQIKENKRESNERFDKLDSKVEDIWKWRFKMAGIIAIVPTIITVAIQVWLSFMRSA